MSYMQLDHLKECFFLVNLHLLQILTKLTGCTLQGSSVIMTLQTWRRRLGLTG